jgi:metallophosphoesterase (TIGR00282 family)
VKVLFIGDIIGGPGREAVRHLLPELRQKEDIDFVLANGENAAGGLGLTAKVAEELYSFGLDVITSGNHIWDKKDILEFLTKDNRLLRPANYPPGAIGSGSTIVSRRGQRLGVINLSGRVFMNNLDCPFRVATAEIERLKDSVRVIVVDMHAEATSEKIALGWYLDGKVSAVIGTHTHVQTADERVLPQGTAYITDLGMTGAFDSVIGVKKEIILERFLTQVPVKLEVAKEDVSLQGALLEIDDDSGRAAAIKRINIKSDAEKDSDDQ